MLEPSWLARARAELGIAEQPGAREEARILAMFRDSGHPDIRDDETAWCAAFVGACLERSGIVSTRSLRARSYLAWGTALAEPRLGAVAVLSRGRDPALGHVGFVVGWDAGTVSLLGGNQGDMVSIAALPLSRLVGYRWPAAAVAARRASPRPSEFERALAHVLRFEGGWSNDPADAGGATNRGITIATLARWRGVRLDARSRPRLESELRQIGADEVADIYLDRYWRAARCEALPPPIAVFHFDCAVNQGVGRAARLLQQGLGVEADGEIGPLTLQAARAAAREELERYADLRRAAYRRTRGFARFGRGWLARVDRTLKFALTLAERAAGDVVATPTLNPTKELPTMQEQPKWWAQSMTLWGAMITLLAAVLPVLSPFLGMDITAEMVKELGENGARLLQGLAGLVGTVLTVIGRLRAQAPLTQRRLSFDV